MPRICYTEKNFGKAAEDTVEQANQIIDEYTKAGYKLTLRQLYYQFVSRDLLPNKQSEYKRLGAIINDGRLAGRIDWSAVEDRGRNVQSPPVWTSPEQILDSAASCFQLDLWRSQPTRVEVWVEKEALLGVVSAACVEDRVPQFACKGYTSQSEMWEAGAGRIAGYIRDKQHPVVLHLGDHDPSGIDMTRDISRRLRLFAGGHVDVVRIALNWKQIEEHQPPPNPAKVSDSRFEGYQKEFGDDSWELDSLGPDVIGDLIRKNIARYRDGEMWDIAKRDEDERKSVLRDIAFRYDEIATWLSATP